MNDERMGTRSGVGLGKAFGDGMTILIIGAVVLGALGMGVVIALGWLAVWLLRLWS